MPSMQDYSLGCQDWYYCCSTGEWADIGGDSSLRYY